MADRGWKLERLPAPSARAQVLVPVVSILLALVAGGVIGAGAATLVLAFGRFSLGAEGVLVEFRPSAAIALASVAIALVVGIAAGLVPAISASRKSIIEGLRSA